MDFRQIILDKLKKLGWSHYRLVQAVKGQVPASTVYHFLAGGSPINSDHLGRLAEAVGFTALK